MPGESEVWRSIPGFDGYEVSNHGRVRSVRCGGRFGENLRRVTPRILVQSVTDEGYHRVGLRIGGKKVQRAVHRLVLLAFVGPCPNGCEGSHSDGDEGNSRLSNLLWETKKENNGRKKVHGTQPARVGQDNPSAKLTNRQRVEIYQKYKTGGISQHKLAEQYRVAQSVIGDITRQSRWNVAQPSEWEGN